MNLTLVQLFTAFAFLFIGTKLNLVNLFVTTHFYLLSEKYNNITTRYQEFTNLFPLNWLTTVMTVSTGIDMEIQFQRRFSVSQLT